MRADHGPAGRPAPGAEIVAPVTAVILAAGEGRRAGGFKPLWPLGEGRVIDRVIAAASGTTRSIRVVGGACFERLRAYIASHHPAIELIENPAWQRGEMFSSVQTGLAGLVGPVFIHPADIPGPSADVYRRLYEAYDKTERPWVKPVHRGRGGHPILLGPAAVRAVQEAPAAANLRAVLRALGVEAVEVDDDLVLSDFDTRAEYERLAARLAKAPQNT